MTPRDRVPNEAEALPEMLRIPLAVADDLLDPAALKLTATDSQDPKPVEEAVTESGPNGEPARTVSVPHVLPWQY